MRFLSRVLGLSSLAVIPWSGHDDKLVNLILLSRLVSTFGLPPPSSVRINDEQH